MVDFRKLRAARRQAPPTHPIEVFRRLPKPAGINDLYTSQAEVLEAWHARRAEKDLVIKLHTGGGKTLVGLLVAQATMNELGEPAIYLCPTQQLVSQTVLKAREYGIPAVEYTKGEHFPDDVHAGKAVLVSTYHALFNGRSRFKIRGTSDPFRAGLVIADDAHVALTTVREIFTVRVNREADETTYRTLCHLFRGDFKEGGRLGTFDDVMAGNDFSVLEVPYWSYLQRLDAVRETLKPKADTVHKFSWPLLRDSLEVCHCLISHEAFVITPVFPLVDMLTTFSDAPRRLFMSATIADDSAIVRTFDADPESVSKPIASKSLAGVSERMILAPVLIGFSDKAAEDFARAAAREVSERPAGVLILAPSKAAAERWSDMANCPETSEGVAQRVTELQTGASFTPLALANRYDGIDLPAGSCRLLVMAGLPKGSTEYDRHLAAVLHGGNMVSSGLAQRIEQGIGRGARGAGDYCVVLILGKDLNAWLGRQSNISLLTSSTRAQLDIGLQISRTTDTAAELMDTIRRCLARDKDWVQFHAETLAELVDDPALNAGLTFSGAERHSLQLWRDGHWDKAVQKLLEAARSKDADRLHAGWMLQAAARIAHHAGETQRALGLQKDAHAKNRNLFRAPGATVYDRLAKPGKQAEAITRRINEYRPRTAYLSYFEDVVSSLVPDSTANQFEESLKELGACLGFSAERPDRSYGVGPDVLWIVNERIGFVIEAKSRKKAKGALTKDEHGQLLNAAEWFSKEYPDLVGIRVSVVPNPVVSKSVVAGPSKAFTLVQLQQLVADLRTLLTAVIAIDGPDQMAVRCEQLLQKSSLTPERLADKYFVSFATE